MTRTKSLLGMQTLERPKPSITFPCCEKTLPKLTGQNADYRIQHRDACPWASLAVEKSSEVSWNACFKAPSEWIGEILKYSKARCDKMQTGTLKGAHTQLTPARSHCTAHQGRSHMFSYHFSCVLFAQIRAKASKPCSSITLVVISPQLTQVPPSALVNTSSRVATTRYVNPSLWSTPGIRRLSQDTGKHASNVKEEQTQALL